MPELRWRIRPKEKSWVGQLRGVVLASNPVKGIVQRLAFVV